MSKVVPHLALPTADILQALDEEGYLLDEDGQLVWDDGPIDGDEQPTPEKVGPLADIPQSLVLLQSLRQTRALYLSTLLPLFQTRSKVRAQPSPPPAPHTQVALGRCTLQIGPCTFTDTRVYEIRYTTEQELAQAKKDADDKANAKAHAEKRAGPATSATTLLATPSAARARATGEAPSANGSAPRPTAGTNITPELIAAVNAAASTDTNLQSILALAATGKASAEQLQFLGGVIAGLNKKKGLAKASSVEPSATAVANTDTPTTPAGPSAPPAGAEAPLPSSSKAAPATRKSSRPSAASLQPDKPLSAVARPPPLAEAGPAVISVADASSSTSPSGAGLPRIPHDIVIEFEENKTDRFLLPLYRCLVSRDPLPSLSLDTTTSDSATVSDQAAALNSTLLLPNVLSTIRLSFFLPLSTSIVPPAPAPPPPPPKPVVPPKSALGPARPYVPPPAPVGAPEEGREGGSVRARASREKALREKWDREEAERVEKETRAAIREKERLEKEERDRERDAMGEGKKRKRRHALGALSGGGVGGQPVGKWPTTVVMEGCSETIWESININWESYVGIVSPDDGVEGMKEECAELLAQVPPKTFLQTRLLPTDVTPALMDASTDKFSLKPYLLNGKPVTRSEKEAIEAEKKRAAALTRKRKAGDPSGLDGAEAAAVEGKRMRKPSAKVQETMQPLAAPSPSSSTPAPATTSTTSKPTKPRPSTSTTTSSTSTPTCKPPKAPKPHHPAHWGPNTHPKKAIPKPPLPPGTIASPAASKASPAPSAGRKKPTAKLKEVAVKSESPKPAAVPAAAAAKGKGRARPSAASAGARKHYDYVLVDPAEDAAIAANGAAAGSSRRAPTRRSMPGAGQGAATAASILAAPPPPPPPPPTHTPDPAAILAQQHQQQHQHQQEEMFTSLGVPQFDPDGTTTNGMDSIMGMFDAPLPDLEHHHHHHHHHDAHMQDEVHEEAHVGMEDYLNFDDD